MIEARGLVKRYGPRAAVDGVDLSVPAGGFLALVGPSGCGKSTLLRLLNGLLRPDAGTVKVEGRDVAATDPQALRRRIGYVIQSVGLFPHWSVADNVAAVPRLLRWSEGEVRARVAEVLALVALDPAEFAGKRPHELSGGQAQRVGVARALAARPPLVLMDEPFGALDPVTRAGLQDELRRVRAGGDTTFVMVTHDLDEALRLGDRVAVMREGRIVQEAAPLDLLARPADAFVRAFLGGAEGALRALDLRRVGGAMRPGEGPQGPPLDEAAVLEEGASLRAGLAALIAAGSPVLPVRRDGAVVGALHLADLARALRG